MNCQGTLYARMKEWKDEEGGGINNDMMYEVRIKIYLSETEFYEWNTRALKLECIRQQDTATRRTVNRSFPTATGYCTFAEQ